MTKIEGDVTVRSTSKWRISYNVVAQIETRRPYRHRWHRPPGSDFRLAFGVNYDNNGVVLLRPGFVWRAW